MKFVRHYAIEPFPQEHKKLFSFSLNKQKFAVVCREPCRDWDDQKYGELYLLKSGGWGDNPYCSWIGSAYPFERVIAQSIVDRLNETLPGRGRPHA